MKKILTIRICIALAYVLLAVLMFNIGRTHTVLVDNHGTDDAPAIEEMLVTLGKNEELDFYEDDRDRFTVQGQSTNLHVEFPDGSTKDFQIKIPLMEDMVLVSVPKLMAGVDGAVEKFVPDFSEPVEEEESNTEEETEAVF